MHGGMLLAGPKANRYECITSSHLNISSIPGQFLDFYNDLSQTYVRPFLTLNLKFHRFTIISLKSSSKMNRDSEMIPHLRQKLKYLYIFNEHNINRYVVQPLEKCIPCIKISMQFQRDFTNS